MKSFSSYNDWKSAVRNAGLCYYLPPSQHEGMHEDDCYATVYAIPVDAEPKDCNAALLGAFTFNPNLAMGDGKGVVCESEREFYEWMNQDERDEREMYEREFSQPERNDHA